MEVDSSEAQEPPRTYVGPRWGVLLIKALVTSVLFGIIIYHVDIFETLQKINMLGAGAALFVLFVLCIQQLIGALRWLLILRSLGQALSPLRSVQIFFASNVAGLVLVTSLGGLSVRGYLLY